ncbi:MAG TPA: chemotaxis protein CheD [Polyangiales bacterium]|nr:chemotaxis protein CheD [Polyangiales bacterium]
MTAIDVTIRIGGVFASDRPSVVRTVLGSCIAVCLFDPVSRVGGMNHYMLPSSEDVLHYDDPARFGLQAMEVLLGNMQRLGARRVRLVAKIFGGAHVVATNSADNMVAVRNIEFIREYVREEGLQVVSQDLGGHAPRAVHFYTHTGKALMKLLGKNASPEIAQVERKVVPRGSIPMDSAITLFDD